MKICPTCQQQYPNGFQYCPNDTDVLVTAEEYLRRTKPISQTPPPMEAPAKATNETAPIVRQPVIETPKQAVTEPVKPPTAAFSTPTVTPRQPASVPTTPVATPASQAPSGGFNNQRNATPANQAPTNGGNAKNGAAASVVAVSSTALVKSADLSFSVPEQGSLIQRLSAALQNISDSFGKGGGKVGDTGDFKFLLKEETLVSRIGRELNAASADFKRDPKTFVVATIKGEGTSKQRQRWLFNGMAGAVIAYSIIFFVIPAILLLLGVSKIEAVEAKKEEPLEMLAELTPMPKELERNKPKSADKSLGSKPIPKKSSGGGGGGREQPTPPSKGRPPQMALTPQIILPNPEPPKIKNPSLVVASTIYGDPKTMPPMKGPIGDPLGVPAPPSSGPGKGGGIGSSDGTGVGRGQGGGLGAGRGGNVGGGDMDIGGGRGIEEMGKNGVGRPTILSREKAKYTEEARQNKVQGTVVLSVIFQADGRITNIRTIRGLPDGLTEKAIEAAQKIRFQPATKNGQAVSVRGNLEFTFNLY
jgi:TonB family protein